MAYVKQNWENLPSTNTPITAERLNHMEDGIAEAWEHGGGSGAGETLRIGTILPYTGSDSELPTGYMLCDGAELSRTDYSDLFAVIGTSFGAGNGSSTFNLPNLKGKVLTGLDSNDEDFASMGATGGEKEHTLTIEEMPSHKHTWTLGANVVANATATSAVTNFNSTSGGLGVATMNNTGGGEAHNILQPYVVVNYIIKVTQSAPVQAQIVGTYTESDIDGYSTEYINELNIFDANERRIGTWIDGKPLYRKVVYVSALPNNTTTSYNHGCQNIDKIWIDTGKSFIYWSSTNATAPLNYLSSAGTGTATYPAMVEIRNIGTTTFDIITGTDRSGQSAWITLNYTKTTD